MRSRKDTKPKIVVYSSCKNGEKRRKSLWQGISRCADEFVVEIKARRVRWRGKCSDRVWVCFSLAVPLALSYSTAQRFQPSEEDIEEGKEIVEGERKRRILQHILCINLFWAETIYLLNPLSRSNWPPLSCEGDRGGTMKRAKREQRGITWLLW
jgi:hypothetical protein